MSKPKKKTLDPACLRAAYQNCISCGYPLEGIPLPGKCPECGVGVYSGRSTLCVSGVARGTAGPLWRKIVWVCIGFFAFVYSQGWGFALMKGMGWFVGLGFVMLLTSITAMIMTSKQRSRGTEQFAFTVGGFSRWPVGSSMTACTFSEWSGVKRGAVVKRVSAVWASLKIVEVDRDGRHTIPLEAGFKCAQEDIPVIQQILDVLLEGGDLEAIESLEYSSFYAIEPGESDEPGEESVL